MEVYLYPQDCKIGALSASLDGHCFHPGIAGKIDISSHGCIMHVVEIDLTEKPDFNSMCI